MSQPVAKAGRRARLDVGAVRAIGRKADARGEMQKGIAGRRVQRLLRDEAHDKVRMIAGGRDAGVSIGRRHQVALAAHLRQQEEPPRVGWGAEGPQRFFPVVRASGFAGGERAGEGGAVRGERLVRLRDGGDGCDDTAFTAERGRRGVRVVFVLIFAGGFIDRGTRSPGRDFGGDGLIEGGQGGGSGRAERGDNGSAGQQMRVDEVGPGCDFEGAAGVLGLNGIWRIV